MSEGQVYSRHDKTYQENRTRALWPHDGGWFWRKRSPYQCFAHFKGSRNSYKLRQKSRSLFHFDSAWCAGFSKTKNEITPHVGVVNQAQSLQQSETSCLTWKPLNRSSYRFNTCEYCRLWSLFMRALQGPLGLNGKLDTPYTINWLNFETNSQCFARFRQIALNTTEKCGTIDEDLRHKKRNAIRSCDSWPRNSRPTRRTNLLVSSVQQNARILSAYRYWHHRWRQNSSASVYHRCWEYRKSPGNMWWFLSSADEDFPEGKPNWHHKNYSTPKLVNWHPPSQEPAQDSTWNWPVSGDREVLHSPHHQDFSVYSDHHELLSPSASQSENISSTYTLDISVA